MEDPTCWVSKEIGGVTMPAGKVGRQLGLPAEPMMSPGCCLEEIGGIRQPQREQPGYTPTAMHTTLHRVVPGGQSADALARLVSKVNVDELELDYDERSDEWEKGEGCEHDVVRQLVLQSNRRSGAMEKSVGVLQKSSLMTETPLGSRRCFAVEVAK
ncbi:hypothetical protein NDU88_002020 [Pleurodeles waltl]|uniref:Uncharacterized protein n=1 Tax=Pleurodeles waltl TaxID=8319 RepID=A0AAV7KT12_PLEWA|nr:hypothetical protein NDU88_002020 [Pleurodeles waltl]